MRIRETRHPHRVMTRAAALSVAAALLAPAASATAQQSLFRQPTPVRQSSLDPQSAGPPQPLTIRDAARPDRWFGVEVRDVRWAPGGESVYFRWHTAPETDQDPEADPWFRVGRRGRFLEEVPESALDRIPGPEVRWSRNGSRAVWVKDGKLYLYDAGAEAEDRVQPLFAASTPVRDARLLPNGSAVDFMLGEDLYRQDIETGGVRQLTRKHVVSPKAVHPGDRWLEEQQMELFEQLRKDARREAARAAHERRLDPLAPQPIPVGPDVTLSNVQVSPDGRYVTFRWNRVIQERENVRYIDYVTASGHSEVREARPKIGEPRDEHRLGIIRLDPTIHPDSVEIVWVDPRAAEGRPTVIHGPYWSIEEDQAVVQVMTTDHKDLFISRLDLATGLTTVVSHEHDPAWLGGPPPLAGRLRPALLEWLPGGRFVFASERTGWSHLYLAEPDGSVRALTSGEWEVRGAELSRDRSRWILSASREHPSDNHLYTMPAAGGELERLTDREGRHTAVSSPDGSRLAVIHGDATSLPDLYLRDAAPGATTTRVTISGADAYYQHEWVSPEIVSFPHPDGRPVWGALFQPEQPNPQRAAVLHIHGGGYRQFTHRGWSVYGYASHIGFINYLVQQGYTVLDFDYRGSAGFGRDYRTDIYRSMGITDVDGAVAAVDYLVEEHGIDRARVGLYGISYGGFFTLMALFRYPGVFAAGVANAAVADWAHYSDSWTSRILNLPYEDSEAFRTSSPIYYAEGLEDPLLIAHGIVDDNVHFQDAARLVQRLIELEKEFEVMYYPEEAHGFRTESSRYDYYRRVAAHFDRHLLGPPPLVGVRDGDDGRDRGAN